MLYSFISIYSALCFFALLHWFLCSFALGSLLAEETEIVGSISVFFFSSALKDQPRLLLSLISRVSGSLGADDDDKRL